MSRIVRKLVYLALGCAAVSMYRQWQNGEFKPHHPHLENWENEGGGLPHVSSAQRIASPTAQSRPPAAY
ncbi:MAG: hypothetical protein ABI533_07030 [Betaproteobacteria bacterium]